MSMTLDGFLKKKRLDSELSIDFIARFKELLIFKGNSMLPL